MAVTDTTRLVACHECDAVHHIMPLPAGSKALCSRCGNLLCRHVFHGSDRVIALASAALICLAIANSYPFLSMEIAGRSQETMMITGALALYQHGMWELGLLVLLTSLLFPLLTLLGLIYVSLPARFAIRLPAVPQVVRLVRILLPWSMLDVLMLGVLIAIVKLLDLATIVPGVAFYAFVALLVLSTAAYASFDVADVWPPAEAGPEHRRQGMTAARKGLLNCHTCALLVPASQLASTHGRCPRCQTHLHWRKHDSVSRTWAWIITATLLLVPANLYPVMTVIHFGQGEPNTILGGVEQLIQAGMWPLGMIVLIASILIPFAKLAVLAWLLLTVQMKSRWRMRDRTLYYRVTELIGAWSMVDIFLVALLTGLVNMGALASIRPGSGAVFFGAAVVATIFAAKSFDPRLIWDHGEAAE